MKGSNLSNSPGSWSERQALLLEYKEQLKSMRDMFLFEMDFREITTKDLDQWERKLRKILEGIKNLGKASPLDDLLDSPYTLQRKISMVINNLYVVSDILHKRTVPMRDREVYYQKLLQCSDILADAIENFKV